MNLGHTLGSAVRGAVRESVRQPDRPTGVWNAIGRVTITRVRDWIEEQDAIQIEVWATAEDERTCPVCAPLDGRQWPAGEGFHPPLHDHCRCRRLLHHLEYRSRLVEVWRDIAIHSTDWVWRTS